MTTEFRLIADLCDIVDLRTRAPAPERALPAQLMEILPRPPETAGEPDADWEPWFYGKVFADDGIRFTEGMVEKAATRPLPQPCVRDDFAVQCASAAAKFGVNAAELFATADYLSGVRNLPARSSSAAGPFLFNEKSWAATIASTTDLGLAPSDRFDPYKQPFAAAAEAADVQTRFKAASAASPPTVADYVFVRLFGRESVDLLTRIGQPGFEDPSIEDVIASYCSGELQGSVTRDALIDEISNGYPDLLGPPNARRKVSEVREALQTALQALLPSAQTAVGSPPSPPPQAPPPSGGNLKLGVNAEYQDEILAAAGRCNMDPAGLAALIDAEAAKLASGLWNRNSTNPKSSAMGLTQFLKGSWIHMATQPRTTLNEEAKNRGIVDTNNRVINATALLALRTDPGLSIMSAAEYAASNLKYVMNKNPNYRGFYDPGTPDGKMRLAYLCHHEGPGGAVTYLRGGKDPSYVRWLDSYIDRKIVPSRFRNSTIVVGPGPDLSSDRGTGTSTTGGGTIPNDVASIPSADPVEFAVLQAPESEWHWPVITGDTNAMKISYERTSGTIAGHPSREFLANRQNRTRYHVGMDIFCHQGDIVVAVADGRIVAFYHFYKQTNALLIEHGGVVINYGEVAPNSAHEFDWQEGDSVSAGQEIARVGRLNMIHFETYRPGTVANTKWMKNAGKPEKLRNPTKLLLGLAARGKRKF